MTEEQRVKFATGYYNKRFLEEYNTASVGTSPEHANRKEYGVKIRVMT